LGERQKPVSLLTSRLTVKEATSLLKTDPTTFPDSTWLSMSHTCPTGTWTELFIACLFCFSFVQVIWVWTSPLGARLSVTVSCSNVCCSCSFIACIYHVLPSPPSRTSRSLGGSYIRVNLKFLYLNRSGTLFFSQITFDHSRKFNWVWRDNSISVRPGPWGGQFY